MRWFLGTAAILLVALVFNLGLLAYAMYALLGVMLVSRLMARWWAENLDGDRECNRLAVNVGEKVAVLASVRNRGRLPVAWVLLEDLLPRRALMHRPPQIRVLGSRLGLAMLRPGAKRTFPYQLEFTAQGCSQIGPLVPQTGDLFGLHRRWHVAAHAELRPGVSQGAKPWRATISPPGGPSARSA